MQPARRLEQHQLEFLEHNGFLPLDAITTADEIEQLRHTYERLFRERVGWEDGNQFDLGGDERGGPARLPQLLNPSQYAPELRQTRFVANATAIAHQILGDELQEGYREQMIYKPARHGPATPWHQDQAYHDPNLTFRSINFWMALDDATVQSGCMQFVPGSHRLDVLPHRSIGGNPAVHGLELAEPERHAPYSVACPIPAGGCTLHAAYALHYTGPNVSESPRRAYTLIFEARPLPRAVPVDNHWMREKRTARMQRQERSKVSGS
jgi:ectoine hydroxylase-related dioxygenase (phytanoyl-CoA dioxygenase family)